MPTHACWITIDDCRCNFIQYPLQNAHQPFYVGYAFLVNGASHFVVGHSQYAETLSFIHTTYGCANAIGSDIESSKYFAHNYIGLAFWQIISLGTCKSTDLQVLEPRRGRTRLW